MLDQAIILMEIALRLIDNSHTNRGFPLSRRFASWRRETADSGCLAIWRCGGRVRLTVAASGRRIPRTRRLAIA